MLECRKICLEAEHVNKVTNVTIVNVKNEDCDAKYFCDVSKEYPYLSQCKSLRTSYEQCGETWECGMNLYCSYANP